MFNFMMIWSFEYFFVTVESIDYSVFLCDLQLYVRRCGGRGALDFVAGTSQPTRQAELSRASGVFSREVFLLLVDWLFHSHSCFTH